MFWVCTYVSISVGYLSAVMRACPEVGGCVCVQGCVSVCLSVFSRKSLNTYSNLIEMGNFNMREV